MLKTKLPATVTTREEAEGVLKALWDNDECFHPEDAAEDCLPEVSAEEADHLNRLMDEMYQIAGFDPCEYILKMINEPGDVTR